ncbi:MAG: hypothetical protein RBS80_25315 [Thermoguttaceae bacterium]|jgi:hypothetical protein|nr:hypothetical protein [Thermoguttaceae bacterium]
MKRSATSALIGAVIVLAASYSPSLAALVWDGDGGANTNWSHTANWDPDGQPSTSATFDDTATAPAGTVTNVVDVNFTIGSLNYHHTSNAHTMQIDSGIVLQLTGDSTANALVLNGLTNSVTTRTIVVGAGKLVVNVPTKDILLTGGSQASGTSTAALDMSGLAEFEATINEFRAGTGANRYAAQATLAATNTIVADAVVVGANTYTTTSHFMRLGTANTIHADKIIVAGARSTADLQYDPSLSGTLATTIRGKAGGDSRAAMWVADQAGNGGYGSGGSSRAVGRVDLTGGTLDARFSTLIVGRNGYVATSQPGGATATFSFDAGTLDATNIIVGLSPLPSSSNLSNYTNPTQGQTLGTLNMGGGTLLAGSMTLGETQGNNTPAYEDAPLDRSTQAHGTFNLYGGTATIVGNVTLAHHTSTGTALATGTINITGGSLEVQGNLVEGAGGDISESTVNVLAGSLTVIGDLMVDTLRVGREGSGTVTTGSGSHVAIGSATSPMLLYVGVRDYSGGMAPVGVLDMSQSDTFTAYLTNFDVGVRTSGSSAGMRGTVKLAADNEVHADRLLIGAAPSDGNTGPTQLVELGDTNVFHVGTLTVADSKSLVNMTFRSAGSTLELGGNGTARANLRIGYNNAGTGATTIGTFNASGSTFNALLQNVEIGYHREPYTTGGEGRGTLNVDQGTIDAVTVTLGNAGIKSSNDAEGKGSGTLNVGGTAAFSAEQIRLGIGTTRSEGTINFSGGTLTAGSIAHGPGSYDFNWTGGTLQVAEFGNSDYDFDLVQSNDDATSILAPGTSIGTTEIFGNYTMEDNNPLNLNVLAIEIAGRGSPGVDYDQVIVHGDAVLGGQLLIDLLGGYDPRLGHSFDILTVGGTISGELTLAGDSPSEYYWEHAVHDLPGGGQVLRLSAIPEPTTFVLLLLGAVGFLAQRVPKRGRG